MNVTVAENVEIFNKTCSKAVEDMTVEYNIFQKESTSLNAAVTVLCSGALLSANDNVIQVAYGATTFLNAISGFGPPRPSNNTGTFGDAPRYPIPQSPMPAAPAPGAVSPPPPAISVQARYARTVSNRILSDILALVHVVDEFKETTGSTTECMSTTEVQTLKESFINITMILTKYENMSTASRLITVLTNEELEQINIAITRMNKAVELVQNSLKSGVKEIKNARKVNAYETTVKEVKENKKTSEEFSKKLSDIRKNNEKSGRRVVSRVFNTARDSSNKAYQNITTARNSLVEKSTSVIKTIRDNSFWIYEYIVKPKLNSLQVKLDKIPVCLTSIFGNLTVSIRSINNITDVTNNKTYQNASMVISQAVTNLTDIIAKDFKINCAQASNDEIQEIQCKFHRDSKNCLEQTSVFNQRAVTNCTNTTIFISQILNDIVAKTDKCIRDAGAPNTYYINFLGYFVRQKIAVCLDPVSYSKNI